MSSSVIQHSEISDAKIYLRAESEVFQLCLKELQLAGFSVSVSQAKVEKVIWGYQSAFWTQASRALRSTSEQKRNVTGYEIPHAAIHYRLSEIEPRLRGYPKVCILSESLAGATEHYFLVAGSKKGGSIYSAAFKQRVMKTLLDVGASSVDAKKKLKRYFALTPFEAYKRAALAEYELTLSAFELITRTQSRKTKRVAEVSIEDEILALKSQVRDWYLIRHKNIAGFILYVSHHCGAKSLPQDAATCRAVLRGLRGARNFKDWWAYLERLKGARSTRTTRKDLLLKENL